MVQPDEIDIEGEVPLKFQKLKWPGSLMPQATEVLTLGQGGRPTPLLPYPWGNSPVAVQVSRSGYALVTYTVTYSGVLMQDLRVAAH